MQYVSLALLGVALLWFATSLAGYYNLSLPWLLPVAVGATLLLPLLALLFEAIRRPSMQKVASIVDGRLDNRQRLLTSVELSSRQQADALDGVQMDSTTRYLERLPAKIVYPVRAPVALWMWSAGLLTLALGLAVLRGAGGGFSPIAVGALPPDRPVESVFATSTPLSGLPDSELTPEPTPSTQPTEVALGGIEFDPSAPPQTDSAGNPIGPPSDDPQDQAAASQEAQSGLDRLGEALDQGSATQAAGDSLRQGDTEDASQQLRELGEENDQLSDEAKRGLAEALERAADQTEGNPTLREAEKRAAKALRNGDYRDIKDSLERLAEAMEQTAANVIPQDQLAQGFPTPTAGPDQSEASQGSQEGDATNSENGGENSGGENSGGEQGSEGQQGGDSGQGSEGQQGEGEGEQPGMGGSQNEGGDGQSQSGAPGQGTRVGGPTDDTQVNAPGNPFELEGRLDPNANRSGDNDRPGLELEGGSGTSGGALPARPGSASDTPGESTSLPLERWDIIRRYFSPEE